MTIGELLLILAGIVLILMYIRGWYLILVDAIDVEAEIVGLFGSFNNICMVITLVFSFYYLSAV